MKYIVFGAAALLGLYLASQLGLQIAALFVLGLVIGAAFFGATFGFTTGWRELLTQGRSQLFNDQILLIAACTAVLLPIITASPIHFGFVRPVGVAFLVGAFVFGLGAQIANGCSSGHLFHLAQGRWSTLATLAAFVFGTMLAVRDFDLWAETPVYFVYSLSQDFGPAASTLISLASLIAVLWLLGAHRFNWRSSKGRALLFAVGLIALAQIGILLVSSRPWSIAQGFALLGTQLDIALGLGWDLDFSDFWSSELMASRLEAPILADTFLIPNIGMIFGALAVAAWIGGFKLEQFQFKKLLGMVLGGFMMGYGATIGFGCNVGAFVGGIVSGSAHGWLWIFPALAGSWIGIQLRPIFGHYEPKAVSQVEPSAIGGTGK